MFTRMPMLMIPQWLLISRVLSQLSLKDLLRLGCTNTILRETTTKLIDKIVSDDENLSNYAKHICTNVLLHTGLNISWTLALDPAYKLGPSGRPGIMFRRAFPSGFSGYLNGGRDMYEPHFNPLEKFCAIRVWDGAIICQGGLAFRFSGREEEVPVRLECRYTSPLPPPLPQLFPM